MSRKPDAVRVYDPETNQTHYEGVGALGNVTLCGQTDWLCQPQPGYDTDMLVDCLGCIAMVEFFENHNFKGSACR